MTQPATSGAHTSGGSGRPRRLGDALARLGGADLGVLRQITRERVRDRFVQMALVLLSTAGLAVLSMSFALSDGLDLHPVVAVACGLVWGFIILNIDRMLILNLSARGGFRRTAMIVLPRILIAALLGIVISTPLVLRVFQTEIRAEIAKTNTQANATYGSDVNATGTAAELDRVRKEIATNEAALDGKIDAVVTPDVQAKQDYLDKATATLTQRRERSDAVYRKLQCELYGSSCEGASQQQGAGPLARALQGEYDVAIGETNAAERDVAEARTALDQARQAASGQNAEALRLAQEKANRELPGLRDREAQLQQAYNDELDDGSRLIRQDDGLLAQIVALNRLGERNVEALITHISVGLLFFMIELLPVLVKIMTSVGAPSVYDRVRELDDNRIVEDAKIAQRRSTKQRDEDERRTGAETKKLRAIEDDMRDRERKLGFRANEHVEKEMTRILDAALVQWSATVQQTLQGGVAQNGVSQNGVSQNGIAPAHPTLPLNGAAVLNGTAAANGTVPANGTAPLNGTAPANGAVPPHGTVPPYGAPSPNAGAAPNGAAPRTGAVHGVPHANGGVPANGPTVPTSNPQSFPTVPVQAPPPGAQVPPVAGPTAPTQSTVPTQAAPTLPVAQPDAGQQPDANQQARAATATVRSNFNMPNGNNL